MTKKLKISDTLSIPVDIVTDTNAILAKKGAGKTYTGSVLAEEMIALGQRIVVVDPTDAWWGLRAKADGSPNGLPVVIFGGGHADLPLDEHMGPTIADLIVDGKLSSCILCTKGFESDAGRIRFLTQFGQRIFFRSKEPLHLFLDEADDYLPQRVMGETAKLLHVWAKIVKQGRLQGIGVTLITQRAAVLHKDVLTQVSTLFVLQTIGPQDIKAISDYVRAKGGSHDAMLDALPRLKKGECFVYSPEFLEIDPPQKHQIRLRHTFNSSATPKVGERRIDPKELAKVDLEALRVSLAATLEKAKSEDPKALQKRIVELERALVAKPVAPAPQRIEVPVFTDAERRLVESLAANMDELEIQMRACRELVTGRFDRLNAKVVAATIPKELPPPKVNRQEHSGDDVSYGPRQSAPVGQAKKLRSGALEILNTLASLGGQLTRKQLASLVGIKPTGSTFSTYLSDLRGLAYVETMGDLVKITPIGLRDAGGARSVDVRALWTSKLRSGAVQMLDEIIARYPSAVSRRELAAKVGIDAEGSTFSTYLSDLVSNGLAERHVSGILATEIFFMNGGRS